MAVKKKVVIKKSKQKQSPDLVLLGEPPTEVEKYLKRVRKNAPEPSPRGRKIGGAWDWLISALDRGDELPLEQKIAASVANRGRNLGYVVRLSKIDDELTMLWFGGYVGVPKKVKSK